jgi:type IV pilus assembly protein PilB
MAAQLENFLLKTGLMTVGDLERCLEEARRTGVTLWDVLTKNRKVSEDVLADTLARWFRLPRVRVASATVDPDAVQTIDDRLARRLVCLPISLEGKALLVAFANPIDYDAIRDVQFVTGLEVRPLVATRTEILDAIDAHYKVDDHLADFLSKVPDSGELRILTDAPREDLDDKPVVRAATEVAPVVKLCNLIIYDGVTTGASDIHIEPGLNDVQVRFRVDGVLRDYTQVPKWLHTPVVSRLKILARLDIAERRLPQDGRINALFQRRPIDIRLSTLPTHFGEKAVLRLLTPTSIPNFEVLGLSPPQISIIEPAVAQPQGMILVTGPTGSGKSTTLYSMLERRKSAEVNIITVEDPIEYQVAGITQVQVNVKAGLTFAESLRSILRQDPDVILVGEMRDAETAEVAFQAATTGHLVLSTLHANGSLATIARLLQLGVEPFQVASSVTLIIAQRLARRVCEQCKERHDPTPDVLERLRVDRDAAVFVRGRGCKACGQTGFSGRVGIYEVVRMTPALRDVIQRRGSEAEMRAAAARGGARFLLDEALRKVSMGATTAEEVLRVIRLEDEDTALCPSCGATIQSAFSTCPYCLFAFRRLCPQCGQDVKAEWRACPYCNSRLQPAGHVAGPEAEPPVPRTASGIRSLPEPARSASVTSLTSDWDRPLAIPGGARAPVKKKELAILIVDDDAEMREAIREALGQLPMAIRVTTARDGVEALEAVERAVPDLVVVDLKMPRMDGFSVCQKLRESVRTAFVPIVMLTASDDEESRTTGYLLGTDDYMAKPFAVGELKARVMRILRRTYGI